MKREDLFRHKEYWVVQIQNDLYGIIEEYMKKNGINRTQLAEKLNVTKGYITQILSGDFDHKVSKLVELALASGKAPVLHFVDLEKYIKDDAAGKRDIYNNDFKPVQYNLTFHQQSNENKSYTISSTRTEGMVKNTISNFESSFADVTNK
jgi:transcriptional regulator with XRE-family HTH domain